MHVVAVISMLIATLFLPYSHPSSREVMPPDNCSRYYGKMCANWRLATWLPSMGEPLQLPRGVEPAIVSFSDEFVYHDVAPKKPAWTPPEGGPKTGTEFVYGNAGPPKGIALYDTADHIAFYVQGCCAWHGTVLAAMVPPPPLPVQHAPLRDVKTVHGLALGETRTQVERLYGRGTPFAVPNMPGVTVLAYKHVIKSPCEQDQSIGFLHDRVVYIELTNGC